MDIRSFYNELNKLKEYDIDNKEPIYSLISIFESIVEKLYNAHPKYIDGYHIIASPKKFVHLDSYEFIQKITIKLLNDFSLILDLDTMISSNDKHSDGWIGPCSIYILNTNTYNQGIVFCPISVINKESIYDINKDQIVDKCVSKIEKIMME